MAFVTPLERRVLMDVYNMTDANIAALDPGIAERLISDQRGGLVYDIIRDDPDKPELATTLGELRADDFVNAAAELPRRASEVLIDATTWTASLAGRAAEAVAKATGLSLALAVALTAVGGYLYLTRK